MASDLSNGDILRLDIIVSTISAMLVPVSDFSGTCSVLFRRIHSLLGLCFSGKVSCSCIGVTTGFLDSTCVSSTVRGIGASRLHLL